VYSDYLGYVYVLPPGEVRVVENETIELLPVGSDDLHPLLLGVFSI
jgi:hypothetical protein